MENKLINVKNLPNLHEVEASPREMSSEYWTPEEKGEYKVGVITDIKEEPYVNEETGEELLLPCIIMLNQEEDGSFNTIKNGSKRLVGTIQSSIESGELVVEKTAIKVTYLGKVKNKTNAFKSDKWSVKSLIL